MLKKIGNFNLHIIKPDIIIHLAGISSSIKAFNNPIDALELNGLVVANICNIIHKNNWSTKLFNASSSEMYKGHISYGVSENDNNFYHNHPYSIAKIMGHSIVDFYRNTYGLSFSNGVLFTVESKYKNGDFLLKKISNHAKTWHINLDPIKLGSLDSKRTILHAFDAAKAIKLILDQPIGDNYVICGNIKTNIKILDLVIQTYAAYNIKIEVKDNILYSDNKIVAIVENSNNGIDTVPIDISGIPIKLNNLGWKQTYSIDDIINEIVNT